MDPILDKKGHTLCISVEEKRSTEYVQRDGELVEEESQSCTERTVVIYCPIGCALQPAEYIGFAKRFRPELVRRSIVSPQDLS